MGIPYYFASLTKHHRGIIKPVKKDSPIEVDVLGIDFNCFIHRYLNDEDPIMSVLTSLEYLTENICRYKQLFISLDGLAPYAKMVNQRYRRMLGAFGGECIGFDRNQISPDTPYMRDLETIVREKFPLAHISTTQEPGEGEHKLILEIEKIDPDQRKSICVYGLDADLILICLQHHKLSYPGQFYLLRETADFNDPKLAIAEFATLSVWKLLSQLPIEIEQYMALCILCFGNDFMPSLGLFSLREDGYDRALHMYIESGKPDLLTSDGRRKFLTHASKLELNILRERIQLRKIPIEKAVIGKDNCLISLKYGLHVLDGVVDMEPVVEAYWKTFHWTLYYFKNAKPLNWSWVYPYPDAPLITDIIQYSEPEISNPQKCKYTLRNQLTFILPEESLRKTRRKVVYPTEGYSETRHPWMKRHEWESKPRISLPWNPEFELTHIKPI